MWNTDGGGGPYVVRLIVLEGERQRLREREGGRETDGCFCFVRSFDLSSHAAVLISPRADKELPVVVGPEDYWPCSHRLKNVRGGSN